MTEVRNHYTLKDSTELGTKKQAAFERALFDHFLPKLPKSSQVLEIGPGKGEFAYECKSRNLSFFGIEASQELFQKLKHSGFEVIYDVVPPIPMESEQFDIVHSKHFVEHLLNYVDVMDFFSEAYRVLKPGGYISVITPNYRTLKHMFFQYEYQHSFVTTKDRLKKMLLDSGYEIVRAFNYFLWLSPKLNWADRFLAQIIMPLSINSLVQGLISTLISEKLVFQIHKTIYDHAVVLARKPV